MSASDEAPRGPYPSDELKAVARQALESGAIPTKASRHWGGRGSGEPCGLCGQAVSPEGLGLELEFAAAASGEMPRSVYLHVPCHIAWDVERRRLIQNPLQRLPPDGKIPDRERHNSPERGRAE
jgi:hypothetical protein